MAKVFNLISTRQASPNTFSVERANDVLPLIRKYTEEALQKTEILALRLRGLPKTSPKFKSISRNYDRILLQWAERIHRLGGKAKGLWLVDFDTGEGCLCWSYPETKVEHFHPYDGGYKTRVKLES